MKKRHLAIFISLSVVASPRLSLGADWPMWRYDAGRTAASPEELPAELHLQWLRELPEPRPAWPASQHKLQFDLSYEPVVMGSTIFVPSMVSDSVTAYDTGTGEERWRFYAEGPVRFAPVAWKGKLYFASDDSYLYCLNAADGSVEWKFNGGPSDRKVLGNDRLVSMWPARGAPVLYDGTVYFAASIWPFMGIFIHALDAETGRVVWSNTGSGSIYIKQPHNAPSFAGVVPQGYLAATEDHLLVAGGRSVPACYDRKTGEFRYFHIASRQFGKLTGGYEVMARGDRFFNGGGMFRLSDGGGLLKAHASVLAEDAILSVGGGALRACSYLIDQREVLKKDKKGKETTVKVYAHKEKREAELDPKLRRLFLRAGSRLYFGGEGAVATAKADADAKKCTVDWQADIEGNPWSMLAADGKLFVVTREGRLYCFAGQKTSPNAFKLRMAEPPPEGRWTTEARDILKATGKTEGYCVALGAGTGRLIEELARQSDLHVIAVDPDAARVAAVRRRLDDQGLYGTRASVHVGDYRSLALPPYLASLAVSEDPTAVGMSDAQLAVKKMFYLLRPYGGKACLRLSRQFAQAVRDARLPNAQTRTAGAFTVLARTGALPGSSDWTHQYADAANTVVSKDRVVKAPLGLLWFGGPPNDKILPRHGHGPSPQVTDGRLFIEGEHLLRAVDVYTGRMLWEKELPNLGFYYRNTSHHPGANEIGSNYVSLPDAVYVAYGDTVLRLDPATGETVKELKLPMGADGTAAQWGYLSVWQNLLIATSSPLKVNMSGTEGVPEGAGSIIEKNGKWSYLAGSHPKGDWTRPDFDDGGWKTGKAGFGFSDKDDTTVLDDMRGKYTAVYIRRRFDGHLADGCIESGLVIRYDDGFSAYLNGKEVCRVGVRRGRGVGASSVRSHEAGKRYAYFPIEKFRDLLREGPNVLAIEGHNTSLRSSDFTLDPYLAVLKQEAKETERAPTPLHEIEDVDVKAKYASAAKNLVVMDRHSGDVLWTREAAFNFRHNAIAVAVGKVFCIDGMSPKKLAFLKRRGFQAPSAPRLLALDARTGEEVWGTSDDVFGTWLGYSAEHDVLLQAGSAYRDRARDEVGQGMVAYSGSDGSVIWKDLEAKYNGPPILYHDRIITNGSSGVALSLLTGEGVGWSFSRNYGCNTVIASENLLAFRSGAAGYCDLANDGGTGNLGGFKSSCTSNLIPANGLLNAPDYTRTCTCAYQNQCSLALVHDPDAEVWTFGATPAKGRLGINFGAPGDRRADSGTLWLDYPSVGGKSADIGIAVAPENARTFRKHSYFIKGKGLRWVSASGVEGIRTISISLPDAPEDAAHTVRLHFCEPEARNVGDRVFHVTVQGRLVLKDFDIVREAGASVVPVVKEFRGVKAGNMLKVSFMPKAGAPLICGIEVVTETGREGT